jgi:hypothetical protein
MLQDSPVSVTVQSDESSRGSCCTAIANDGREGTAEPGGVNPEESAEARAVTSSCEIACTCALETLLLLELPQERAMDATTPKTVIANALSN